MQKHRLLNKLKALLGADKARRVGKKSVIGLFFVLTLGTAGASIYNQRVNLPGPPLARPHVFRPDPVGITSNDVIVSAQLSQTKVAQGVIAGGGEVFVDLIVKTPIKPLAQAKKSQALPTDMVVILDKSGSMGSENRLPFAKAAIRELIERMSTEDRLALVTFDNYASVHWPLEKLSTKSRQLMMDKLAELSPSGSTHMSAGISQAGNLFDRDSKNKSRRVILLSDGEANQGITSKEGLEDLVKALVRKESVVSTIGMGLGFNETLMSSLADHGMGNFSYLEQLGSLGKILEKDLAQSRQLFALSSHLTVQPLSGVTVTDAGGYPMETLSDGSLRIPTGQLLSGATKSFVVSLKVPTEKLGKLKIGHFKFNYSRQKENYLVEIPSQRLEIAVVERSRQKEVADSVNDKVFKKSWVKNNLGKMKRMLGYHLKRGDKREAENEIARYRAKISDAQLMAPQAISVSGYGKDLDEAVQMKDDAFSGTPAEQRKKQNQLGKASLSSGLKSQRSTQ